jgi:hypothetical protein
MKLPIFNQLISVPRFSNIQLIKSESVSDHIWGMISLAYEVIPEINKERKSRNFYEINIKDVIYRITLHDLDEAISCDIPRPFKHFDDKIQNELLRVSTELLRKYGINEDLINQINEAKHGSIEGLYVLIFDLVQCGNKMCNEIDLGNKLIKLELPNVIKALDEIRSDLSNENEIEINYITKCITAMKTYVNE